MHRLVIHEYIPKVIGRRHCGHWETFQHRIRPIIGDNWIILYTGDPSYLRKQTSTGFKTTADVTRPYKPSLPKAANYLRQIFTFSSSSVGRKDAPQR